MFDFEQNQEFIIRVQAKNESNQTTEKEFIVSITNDPSDDPVLTNHPLLCKRWNLLTFDENQPSGTQVGQFTAEDPDGDDVRFSLLNVLSSEDNFFELNASGGGGKLLFADLNKDGREDWVDGSGRIYLAEENGFGAEIKLPASGVSCGGGF